MLKLLLAAKSDSGKMCLQSPTKQCTVFAARTLGCSLFQMFSTATLNAQFPYAYTNDTDSDKCIETEQVTLTVEKTK